MIAPKKSVNLAMIMSVAKSTVVPVSIVSIMLVINLSGPYQKKVECLPVSKRICLSLEPI